MKIIFSPKEMEEVVSLYLTQVGLKIEDVQVSFGESGMVATINEGN